MGDDSLIGLDLDGRYRVLRVIGRGGMGTVYEIKHVDLGRHFALKVLKPVYAKHPAIAERFRREARAATRVRHPHITEVTDVGRLEDGRIYFVMELVDGEELADLIDQIGPLPIRKAVSITRQICDGLQVAHANGIVHRDLKPENILLIERDKRDDFVKVVDFGIALHADLAAEEAVRLTTPGLAVGTPQYMAPEQATGADVDHRADIYATSAMLYEMLTGELPHQGSTLGDLIREKQNVDPVPPSRERAEISEELESIVLRGLQRAPEQRFQSMEEMAQALRPIEAELDLYMSSDSSKVSAPAYAANTIVQSRRQRLLFNTGVLVTGLLALLTLWLYLHSRHTQHAQPVRQAIPFAASALSKPPAAEVPGATHQRPTADSASVLPAAETRPVDAGIDTGLHTGVDAGVDAGSDASVDAGSDGGTNDRPTTSPTATQQTEPPLTRREADRLLEWARRAAAAGRYSEPAGDNVADLLQRVNEHYPKHRGAERLRRSLCRDLMRRGGRKQRRQPSEAIAAYQGCHAVRPEYRAAKERLLTLLLGEARKALRKRDYRQAQDHSATASTIAPKSVKLAELIGDIARKQRHFRAARRIYKALLKRKISRSRRKRVTRKLRSMNRKPKRRR